MSRVRIHIDLGGESADFDISPQYVRMADHPADLAAGQLRQAVADAEAWLAARRPAQTAPTEETPK